MYDNATHFKYWKDSDSSIEWKLYELLLNVLQDKDLALKVCTFAASKTNQLLWYLYEDKKHFTFLTDCGKQDFGWSAMACHYIANDFEDYALARCMKYYEQCSDPFFEITYHPGHEMKEKSGSFFEMLCSNQLNPLRYGILKTLLTNHPQLFDTKFRFGNDENNTMTAIRFLKGRFNFLVGYYYGRGGRDNSEEVLDIDYLFFKEDFEPQDVFEGSTELDYWHQLLDLYKKKESQE